MIQILIGNPFVDGDKTYGNSILIALLYILLKAFTDGHDFCVNALYLHPCFGPLFICGFVATEYINGIKLKDIMNEGYQLLTKSTLYNQKSLHVINFSEEVDAFITLGEDIDVVDDVLQLCQRILTIVV